MSEVAVAEPGVEIALPRALGSGAAQDRDELRGAPIRSLPRPSLLDAPLTALRGAGPKLAAAAAELGIESVGDLLRHIPHGYRDRAEVREVAELRIGEEATVMVEVRSARVRPTRRRNLRIVEATVADASGPMKATWFNQAWLARAAACPGTRLLLNGRLDRQGFRVEAHEIVGADGAGAGHPHDRPGARPPGLGAPAADQDPRMGLAGDRGGADWRSSRCRRSCAPVAGCRSRRDALRAAHFPDAREQAALARERLALEELLLHQVALAARRGERRESRPGIAIGPRRRAGRPLAGVASVRADRRPARRLRRARRRSRLRAADAAAADGRGRLGQDRVRPLRDAARARGRPPGGADGADRDARRAARGDARPPARRRADPVRAAHRGDARGAAAARPWPGSPPASSAWWSARTR